MPSMPKTDVISKEDFTNIVINNNNIRDIAKLIGYTQLEDKRVWDQIINTCKKYNIDTAHITFEKQTKYCSMCNTTKPITDFYKSNGKYSPRCKACTQELERKKYQQIHTELNNYKALCKCAKCGDNRSYVLDFHHINPEEKDFTISDNSHAKLDTLLTEIKKCVPLCANCHREFHYLEKTSNITLHEYLNAAME